MSIFNSILRFLFDISPKLIGPKKYIVKSYDVQLDNIILRVYKPNDESILKPVIIYYHGGGWVIGSIKAYDRVLRYLCAKSDAIIIGVEYRRAPEYKFPTALKDAYAAYKWVVDNISNIQGDINRIIFCGDSAGGNLSLGMLRILNMKNQEEEKNILPSQIILIYPLLDSKLISNQKMKKTNIIYKVSEKILRYSLQQYLASYKKYKSPYISFIDKFDQEIYYPSMFIITAEYDALTPGINKFSKKLEEQKIHVKLKEYSNTLHGFINFSGISLKGELALKDIANYIKTGL